MDEYDYLYFEIGEPLEAGGRNDQAAQRKAAGGNRYPYSQKEQQISKPQSGRREPDSTPDDEIPFNLD